MIPSSEASVKRQGEAVRLSSVLKDFGYSFALLGMVFIPFPFHLSNWNQHITKFIFEDFLVWFNDAFLGFSIQNTAITSDSTTMYLLILALLFLASIEVIVLNRIKNIALIWQKHRNNILSFTRLLISYYIAVMLLKYGFDKVFKGQFYLPEPNILYTPLGKISKDLLYWSTMGTSYFYTVFLGLAEVFTASLLLFRRTRLLGLVLALGIFTNIVAVNFGFDISVKIYSCFLWFITFLALQPHFQSFYQFFIAQKTTTLPASFFHFKKSPIKASVQTFIIGLFILEALLPYLQTQTWNDDTAPRPFLHGAYQVIETTNLLDSTLVQNMPIKRFFIHRHNYLIFQDQQDNMVDYKLHTDTIQKQLFITDYNLKTIALSYQKKDSILTIQYPLNGQIYQLKGKSLNWKNLPALQRQFHWRVE